jgi:nucleoside-diphosphate-sugar epimerase
MVKRVVVTGGAGFIGSHIARRLVNDGFKVVVLDNLSEGKMANIADIKDKITFYKEDILNLNILEKLFSGISYIFHEAAIRSVPRSVANPLETIKVNIEGTLNVLLAARKNKAKRVIFASSSSVYGEQKKQSLSEDLPPNPLSPYALSKLTGELMLKQFADLYGLETISLRYFNVFGPYQDPANEYANVIPIFITKMLNNEAPVIHWDGQQSRDFTYIDNVVEANMLAMKVSKTSGEIINVCEGKTTSINELFELINKNLHKNFIPRRGPKRVGDPRCTLGNPSLGQKKLGFKTKINFALGLQQTIDWFKANS